MNTSQGILELAEKHEALAVEAAVEAEREACAMAAYSMAMRFLPGRVEDRQKVADKIAAGIRERGKE